MVVHFITPRGPHFIVGSWVSLVVFKCELRHDLFYVDNTEQVRGELLGHA